MGRIAGASSRRTSRTARSSMTCPPAGGTPAKASSTTTATSGDGFPGLVRHIDRWTFGEDSCAIELTLSGTHDGLYRGIEPTGRKLELRIMAHFSFDADSRITQETAYYDAQTFMRQPGLSGETRS